MGIIFSHPFKNNCIQIISSFSEYDWSDQEIEIIEFLISCQNFFANNQDLEFHEVEILSQKFYCFRLSYEDHFKNSETLSNLKIMNQILLKFQFKKIGFFENKVYRDLFLINHLKLFSGYSVFCVPIEIYQALVSFGRLNIGIRIGDALKFKNKATLELIKFFVEESIPYSTVISFETLKNKLHLEKKYLEKNGKWNFKNRILQPAISEINQNKLLKFNVEVKNERNSDEFIFKVL